MRAISLLAIYFICSFSACANEMNNNKHLYFGLNTYYRDYSEQLIAPSKSDEHGTLYGFVIEFEHKAPKRVMFSVAMSFDGGSTTYDGSIQDHYGNYLGPHKDRTVNLFMSSDTLLGYSLQFNPQVICTPFIGIGHKGWGRGLDYVELYQWSHVSTGLQVDYKGSGAFHYGLRIKVMPMIEGTMALDDSRISEMTLGNKTHFEISLPIEYTCNTKKWRVTPYYSYQSFGESNPVPSYYQGIYIQEPASRTHIAGLKAEYIMPIHW